MPLCPFITGRLRPRRPRWASVCLMGMLLATLAAGCARYHIGTDTLYPAEIRTVYVPVFDSATFRPGLGEQLTEAVVKEIEKRTPYKVVDSHSADSILTGQIVNDSKRLLIISPTDEGRELQTNLVVRVSWVDRQGELLRQGAPIPVPTSMTTVSGNGIVVPEAGQSIATGHTQAIERIATQIVSLMEAPW